MDGAVSYFEHRDPLWRVTVSRHFFIFEGGHWVTIIISSKGASILPLNMECRFVSSRGILYSCKSYQRDIASSRSWITEDILKDICDNDTVYVCTSALPAFVKLFLPRLTHSITLVSGDADEAVYTSNVTCATLLASPFITRWFAQNCLSTHPKLIHMPIGLDYHTMAGRASRWGPKQTETEQESELMNLRHIAVPFHERLPLCYSNFHLNLNSRDRYEARDTVTKELVFYEPVHVQRHESHTNQIKYAFVLSPAGIGRDCHRTWEALVLGCIPIVKSSGLDPLFEGLPVLIVKKWSDVTRGLLDTTILSFKGRTFSYEKLTMKYWQERLTAPLKSAL